MRWPVALAVVALILLAGCFDIFGDEDPADGSTHEQLIGALACDDHDTWASSDYGYMVQDGSEVRFYQESNGRDGLQSEESCPSDPDDRVP